MSNIINGIEPTEMKFTWTCTAKLTKVSGKTTATDTDVGSYTYSIIGTTIPIIAH